MQKERLHIPTLIMSLPRTDKTTPRIGQSGYYRAQRGLQPTVYRPPPQKTHLEGGKQPSEDLWGRRGWKAVPELFHNSLSLLQFFHSGTRELFLRHSHTPPTQLEYSRWTALRHFVLKLHIPWKKKNLFIAVFHFYGSPRNPLLAGSADGAQRHFLSRRGLNEISTLRLYIVYDFFFFFLFCHCRPSGPHWRACRCIPLFPAALHRKLREGSAHWNALISTWCCHPTCATLSWASCND